MLISHTNITGDDLEQLKSRSAHISYSQFAEDLVLALHLTKNNGFYVDVGCHDPFRYSNTAIFHLYRNWRGINIDADIKAIEKFRRERPHDTNIHCGVGSEAGELEFSIFKDGAQNSFDEKMIERASSSIERVERVPIRPLRDILDEFLPHGQEIDLLNVDCEGFDDKVVEGNDWTKYRPASVSIEMHGLTFTNVNGNKVVKMLRDVDYYLSSQLYVTSIFRRR